MNANPASDGQAASTLDGLKWAVVAVGIVAGVVGNWYFGDESLLFRALGLVVLGAGCVAVAALTAQGRAIAALLKESRNEIRRVVWPTRDETLQTTLVVVVVLLVFGLVLWLLDTVLSWIIASIIG
jgi:preprotein translocase subunit SecE